MPLTSKAKTLHYYARSPILVYLAWIKILTDTNNRLLERTSSLPRWIIFISIKQELSQGIFRGFDIADNIYVDRFGSTSSYCRFFSAEMIWVSRISDGRLYIFFFAVCLYDMIAFIFFTFYIILITQPTSLAVSSDCAH